MGLCCKAISGVGFLLLTMLAGMAEANDTSSNTPELTLAVIRSANADGSYYSNDARIWATLSGVAYWKLLVTSTNGLVDSDNHWPQINYALPNGNLTFALRGDARSPSLSAWDKPYYGLDLYFNNEQTARIRGFLTCDTTNTMTNPCTWAGVNPSSPTNSLVTTFNGTKVELTGAGWFYSTSDLMDSSFLNPNRNPDRTGSMTLSVSAVPEPEAWMMMLAGLGLMGTLTRQRRGKKESR